MKIQKIPPAKIYDFLLARFSEPMRLCLKSPDLSIKVEKAVFRVGSIGCLLKPNSKHRILQVQ